MNKNFKLPATLLCDFYKVSHREQYPENTEVIYATWTPRTSRKEGINKVVAFGFQGFIKEYLIDYFNENFFNRPLEEVVEEYARVIKYALGKENPDTSHIEALHKLGYIPVKICAVPEGTLVPIRVPMMTIENTIPEFFWITNYLETLMSCYLWQPMTSATISKEYREVLDSYAKFTGGDESAVAFQGHDFSLRGMGSLQSGMTSGAGHLLNFTGTDTIPSILYLENYYNSNIEKELIGSSIPATEHSVQCAGGEDDELETYRRLINEVYPSGIASIVSDTWDLWAVLTEILPQLKDDIMMRDGKIVIRPDSGDPVKIVCGDPEAEDWRARKGVIELLWDLFGGTKTSKGYKVLDSHIGCIYGDAITIDRCREICSELAKKGFASTNMVYGIGSFTFQYNTRDTFGFALKTTYAVIDGEEKFLFKNPKTDDGTKKSQRGKVIVMKNSDGELELMDGLNEQQYRNARNNLLETVFENGKIVKEQSLSEIRERLAKQSLR